MSSNTSASKRLPRQQPRLDVRVALPVAAVLDQIRLESAESPTASGPLSPNGRRRMSTRYDEAVLRALIEQLDQELPEPQVVLLHVDLRRAFHGAVRIQEHEIHVGREVQLAAAELAHAEHEQRQRLAAGIARPAEARLQACRPRSRAPRR